MKKHTLLFVLISLCLPLSATAIAEPSKDCPTELVNFWQKFSQDNDAKTMPGFLVVNDCVAANNLEKETDFYITTQKRFDKPDNEKLVDQLYTNLSWTDGYSY